MAAEQGGNCELTKPGEAVVHAGVTIIGYTDLASRMAHVASDLYGTNLWHLLEEMGGHAGYKIDHDNDAVRPALVLEGGDKRWPAPPMKAKAAAAVAEPKPAAPSPEPKPVATQPPTAPGKHGHGHGHGSPAPRVMSKAQTAAVAIVGLLIAGVWLGARYGLDDTALSADTQRLIQHATVFVMAVFVGFQVVWNVTPALHTPLMSVTNAISGIIVIGGLLDSIGKLDDAVGVAVIATAFATINIAGGFLVTRRMLAMFRK
jgi:NAD(P) transhydrogenase subunit alpha